MAHDNLKNIQFNDLASSALILLILACTLHATHLLSRVDNLIYDLGQRLVKTAPPNDVIIIAIDESSLAELGRWPWSRKVHADLLQRLNVEQPAAVGFDIIFSEPDQSDAAADEIFARAVASSGKVVLPVLLESTRTNGQLVETLPLPSLIASAADLGRVHALLDEDSIARSVYLHEGLGQPVWQLFAQAVINVANHQPTQNHFGLGVPDQNPYALARQQLKRVNFLGPPGHFPSISYAQVLKGEFPKYMFNNKIVLVGATAQGMNDFLTTPVSGLGVPMSGVEFHANVLESIRTQHLITAVPFWLNLLLVMMLSIMPLLWIPKLPGLAGFLATLGFMIIVGLSAGLLTNFGVWILPSAALIAILMAYPIWSWRKLEAAQEYLDNELAYLKQHLFQWPLKTVSDNPSTFDRFDARIEQVRLATEQLRYLQEDKKETLAFISHDLRAPIASALMAINDKSNVDKLRKPLSQALALAEDFLQASRAEIMDSTQFYELDLAGLVHQSIDDAYEAAIQNEITLQRQIADGVYWLQGNFGLLQRAVLNLILNAIKFGPKHSEVIVGLSVNKDKTIAKITVTDFGSGISALDQALLFKRYSRTQGTQPFTEGAGLGLYFVHTVVTKHQGTVEVSSQAQQPTVFTIHLPITAYQF